MAIPKISNYSLQPIMNNIENRVDWPADSSRAVLLVHDMQRYFVNFYDRSGEPMSTLIKNIETTIERCRAAGIPIVYTAQPPHQTPEDRALLTDFWGTGLTDDNDQQAILDDIAPQKDDLVYTKWRYSAFQRTDLHKFMGTTHRDQLWICGVYAHIGILSTALEAFMTDIKPIVIADAVADFSENEHRMALNYVSQRCGKVVGLNEVVAATQIQVSSQGEGAHQSSTNPVYQQLVAGACAALGVSEEELDKDENLFEMGLDSIRLMAMVDVLRENNIALGFAELAERPTLEEWKTMLDEQTEATID